MFSETRQVGTILSSMFALIFLLLCTGQLFAQTHFDFTVTADAASPDFISIPIPAGGFLTPTGVGPNRKTIIRIVTPTPTAGVTFEITPPAGKTATRIVVDGATGAIEVQGTGVPVTSNVIAEVISDAPDNAPVAPNFALVRVTIDYAPNFDFGGVAETWTLKVKEMPTERRYMGFIATATNETDTLVTRPKMHIEGSE